MWHIIQEDKGKLMRGALYPNSYLSSRELTIYKERLDMALNDNKVTNIAVTGPYDTGKSSILLSYFSERSKKSNILLNLINRNFVNHKLTPTYPKYQFINIANFFDDKKENEGNLEKKIIDQLLFTTNSRKFPDSNINRLRSISDGIIFIVCCITSLFFYMKFNNISSFVNENKFFSLFFWVLGFILIKYLIHVVLKLNVSITAKIGDDKTNASIEIAEKDNDNKNYFIQYGDELKYYFKKSKVKYVVFEDMDRFENPKIFQRLRELNLNLNKYGKRIVFIYTLRDSIFAQIDNKEDPNKPAKLRSKFFDYIIPVFPLHSLQNSKEKFVKEIDKYPSLKNHFRINDNYIEGLGKRIHDSREITTIISELDLYVNRLDKKVFEDSDSINKLLGVITYKIIRPDDFDKIYNGDSDLNLLFDNQNLIFSKLIEYNSVEINTQIKKLSKEIKVLKESVTKDLDTLIKIKCEEASSNFENYYQNGFRNDENMKDFYTEVMRENNYYARDIRNNLNLSVEEKQLLDDYVDGKISVEPLPDLTEKLKSLEAKRNNLRQNIHSKKLVDLIHPYIDNSNPKDFKDAVALPSNTKFEKELLENIGEFIKYISENDVLNYLFMMDLVDSNYYEYLSPTAYFEVSPQDGRFINRVETKSEINVPDWNIDNPAKVFDILAKKEVNFEYAYSPNILAILFEKRILDEGKMIINNASDKKDFVFIFNTITFFDNKTIFLADFVNQLIVIWPDFFKEAINSNNQLIISESVKLAYREIINEDEKLFDNLSSRELFDLNEYKNEFCNLKDNEVNILVKKFVYKFKLLKFNWHNPYLLNKLIEHKWYEENYRNFEILACEFNHGRRHAFPLINSFDPQFCITNIFEYINGHIKGVAPLKFNEFKDIIKLSKDVSDNEKDEFKLNGINLLGNIKIYPKLSEEEITYILEQFDFNKYLQNQAITSKCLNKLIEKNRITYNSEYLSVIENNYSELVSDYLVSIEDSNSCDEILQKVDKEYISSWIGKSKKPGKIIKEIEKYNTEDLEEIFCINKIDNNGIAKVIKYTNDLEIINALISCSYLDINNKLLILKKIINTSKFHKQVSINQYMAFYFNDQDYLKNWKPNGNKDLPNINDHKEAADGLMNFLEPLGLKSKNKKYAIKSNFMKYFK